ncbi:MAG: SpoIIE family protein phosphatase [Desulfobacterales bacterium]|jgi:serine phosphatase RsbU (regulator of sigma subunit)
MPGGYSKIACRCRSLAGVAVILVLMTCGGIPGPAAAAPAETILQLTPDKDRYFLGPYLAYLEDPQKKLTIDEVSSPKMSARFVQHAGKILNLGLNSSAHWIRFSVDAFKDQTAQRTWLLYLDWPNRIDYATLYIPKFPDGGWFTKEVGRILPSGLDPQPSTPTAFLPPESFIQTVTFYLRVESSEAKHLPLQILTDEAYQSVSRGRSLWFGIYYGIMLAMFLYNLILLISLRELNRFYYLMYLLFIGLLFLKSNGLLWEHFQIGPHLGEVLVLIFIALTFFWGILFAKSFLIIKKHAPFFDKLLSVAVGLALVLAAMIPFVNIALMTLAISFQSIVVPPIFILAALICWRRGFGPARFFLLAFTTLALSTMYEALVIFGVLPYLTLYSGQFTSAIEVILLQLALADRFRSLSLEHDIIKQSLDLAREVQQNLLPHKNPQMERLDIAGRSIYCDETGGDYYDFITSDAGENGQLAIAIGDVSGHGVSSALLMATVRSSLRQRLSQPGSAGDIISDVNRQLAHDVEDSGQFMTLFYLMIDPTKQDLQWVRAGHDPAIFYDPGTDTFEELGGSGVALGVMEDSVFKAYTKTALRKGQIIFLSTDGIWESRNQKREMFGKKPIYDIIRKNSSLNANETLEAILDSLERFQQGAKIEDDITLVVIKIKD